MAVVTICSDFWSPPKIKSVTVSIVFATICHEVMGPDTMILVFWMLRLSQLLHSPLSPCGSDSKASALNAGDLGSIPGSGRFSGEGNGNPLQYSCLENPMGGRAWKATVQGVSKSWTQLNEFTSLHFISFTFIKRLFSSSFSAIRVVSSAYLRL